MKGLDYTLLTVAIIGAINWGLIGIFRFDLVATLFGSMSWLSRLVYILVGLAGLYLISLYGRVRQNSSES
ncbi:DUF378 domain-containing protein [Cuneatibacter sp. NSJ-177]|uniref:DUF378 domain-containing protein n=1 Tax=Cuneatibacter sp. NSJ-177 TaxID=2931401 RepID=UPI001FD37440|nr:DUF378 domain-containing protein [Cuneatibacter sp. NSJ-177]MCJ7836443.1 DUF378 domain-containing protein [Cuneatibacter sp. NSJ-177]